MECSERKFWDNLRAGLLLLVLLTYQLGFFILSIVGGLGLEIATNFLHRQLFNMVPPLPLETYVMLYFVYLSAEMVTELQYQHWHLRTADDYPFLLTVVPNIVYTFVYALCFANIFFEFRAFHSFEDWNLDFPEEDAKTFLYMVSISYIIFCTTRLLHKDMFIHFVNLPHPHHSHCVVVVFLFVIQVFLTMIYALPLTLLAYISISLHWNVQLEFWCFFVASLGLGALAGLLEMKIPCSREKNKPPYCLYENTIYARILILDIGLYPSVHYLFFEPGKFNPISTDDKEFILFNYFVSICILHLVKVIFIAHFSHKNADILFGWEWGRRRSRSSTCSSYLAASDILEECSPEDPFDLPQSDPDASEIIYREQGTSMNSNCKIDETTFPVEYNRVQSSETSEHHKTPFLQMNLGKSIVKLLFQGAIFTLNPIEKGLMNRKYEERGSRRSEESLIVDLTLNASSLLSSSVAASIAFENSTGGNSNQVSESSLNRLELLEDYSIKSLQVSSQDENRNCDHSCLSGIVNGAVGTSLTSCDQLKLLPVHNKLQNCSQ